MNDFKPMCAIVTDGDPASVDALMYVHSISPVCCITCSAVFFFRDGRYWLGGHKGIGSSYWIDMFIGEDMQTGKRIDIYDRGTQ